MKKLLSALLVLVLCLGMLPSMSFGAVAETAAKTGGADLSEDIYKALGLSTEAPIPAQAKKKSNLFTQHEMLIDVTSAFNSGKYLRDNLNLSTDDSVKSSLKDRGAYALYDLFYTGTTDHKLTAANGRTEGITGGAASVIKKFDVKSSYNTASTDSNNEVWSESVAMDLGEGKDNYLAKIALYDTASGNTERYFEARLIINKVTANGIEEYRNAILYDFWLDGCDSLDKKLNSYVLDGWLDIVAGDFDGDGKDSLVVKRPDGTFVYNNFDNDYLFPTSYTTGGVDSIAVGDIDHDLKEDLVIMFTNPLSFSSYSAQIYLYVDGLSRKMQFSFDNRDSSKRFHAANVAIGDGDGDGYNELYYSYFTNDDFSAFNIGTIPFTGHGATLKPANKLGPMDKENSFVHIDRYGVAELLVENCTDTEGITSQKVFVDAAVSSGLSLNELRYIPMPLAVVNLGDSVNKDCYVLANTYLFKFEGDALKKSEHKLAYETSMKTNNNGSVSARGRWISDVIVGNFDGDKTGSQDLIVTMYLMDTSEYIWGQFCYISKDQTSGAVSGNCEGVISSGRNLANISKTDTTNVCYQISPHFSIAALDIDNDGILLDYQGADTYYTEPKVQTVLQSAPYFQDVEDYFGYLNNSTTAIGYTTGGSKTKGASLDFSLGAYTSAEVSLGGAAEIEASLTADFSFEYEHETSKSVSVNYAVGAGEDMVVLYTVPYVRYNYISTRSANMTDSETLAPGVSSYNNSSTFANAAATAKWDVVIDPETGKTISNMYEEKLRIWEEWAKLNAGYIMKNGVVLNTVEEIWTHYKPKSSLNGVAFKDYYIIETPQTAVTTIISVDTYDKIASKTEGMETIRGNILNNIAGDPSTYQTLPKGEQVSINTANGTQSTEWQLCQAVSNTNTWVEITQEIEESKNYNFALGITEELQVGAGGGFFGNSVVAGLKTSLSIAGSWGYSNFSGTEYVGAVDNMPAEAKDYSFNWKLNTVNTQLNGQEIIIICYQTKNIKSAPSTPKNLVVTEVSDSSLTLEWDATSDAAEYKLYEISLSTGRPLWKKTLTRDDAVDGKLTWTATGRDSSTTYTYYVQAVDSLSRYSFESNRTSARTMPKGIKLNILTQPDDVMLPLGKTAVFKTEATISSGAELYYLWQYYDESADEWVDTDNYSNILSIKIDDYRMDGTKYRCMIYDSSEIYTQEATLNVGAWNFADEPNVLHLIRMKKLISGATSADKLKYDITSDGEVTATDITLLTRYIFAD